MSPQHKNDDAVSPVIGEILMVAIVVILAAIIFAMIFIWGSAIPDARNIGVTAQQDSATLITVKYWGGPDDDLLSYLRVFAPNSTQYYTSDASGALTQGSGPGVKPNVGAQIHLYHNSIDPSWDGQQTLVVVAVYTDDIEQVVVDTTV